MPSFIITRQFTAFSGGTKSKQEIVTGDLPIWFEKAIPNGSTNLHFVIPTIVRANLKGLCFYTDRQITVYTQAPSTGSPQDTIPLSTLGVAEGEVLPWTLEQNTLTGTSNKCPISANVTDLYITNASGGTANFILQGMADV